MKRYVFVIAIVATLIARTLLINVNSAEWGDSYRILRASNFVQQFSYPSDEKRPPLFSIPLAIRPTNIDAVLWGRVVMLGISFLSLYVFYKLSKKYLATQNQRIFAITLLALNPVYLYWSLRIYADVPFSLLVMLCFYVFELWREKWNDQDKPSMLYPAVMGFICGLGILTRFEGHLLTLATIIGILVVAKAPSGQRIKVSAVFFLSVALVTLPWLIYRNPLTSSYFEETAGRKYDIEMLLTYLVSYIFVLGIIPAGSLSVIYFSRKSPMKLPSAFKKYPHIVIFILLESFLILAWPAAIPRLFVPIIPFLIIAFVKSFASSPVWKDRYDEGSAMTTRKSAITGVLAMILTAIYIIAQNHLRLQFLGPHTVVFVFISAVSVICTLSIILKHRQLFILSAVISMLTLSASTIYLHKDIYRSIKEISTFSLSAVADGKIIHNDTASIVNWYFPESEYKNLDNKKYLTQEYLTENNIDYIILTNEFDPNLEINLKKRPYLELVKESKHTTGGKMFFTWLIKVQR